MQLDKETKAEIETLRNDPSIAAASTLVIILSELDFPDDQNSEFWDLLTVARHRLRTEPAQTAEERRAKIAAWRAEADATVERSARETKAGLGLRLDVAFDQCLDALQILDATVKDVEAGRPISMIVPQRCEI